MSAAKALFRTRETRAFPLPKAVFLWVFPCHPAVSFSYIAERDAIGAASPGSVRFGPLSRI